MRREKNIFRQRLCGLLTLLLLAVSSSGGATTLYSGLVSIHDESASGRNVAIREAFRQVLVKVTGSERHAAHPALQQEITAAESYLLSYGFRDSGSSAPQRWLYAEFDPERVNRLLSRHNIPIWHAQRPSLLVWLEIERGEVRRVAQPELDHRYVELLTQAAERRGIPLLFPLMDLEDRTRISQLSDTPNSEIAAASVRYGNSRPLVGLLREGNEGGWSGRWSLLDGAETATWSSAGATLSAAVQQAMDGAADRLAQRYAPPPVAVERAASGESRVVLLHIEDIRSRHDYARSSALVRGLGSVTSATLYQATSAALSYRLQLRGPSSALEQELNLSGILQRQPGGSSPSDATLELRYRLTFAGG